MKERNDDGVVLEPPCVLPKFCIHGFVYFLSMSVPMVLLPYGPLNLNMRYNEAPDKKSACLENLQFL